MLSMSISLLSFLLSSRSVSTWTRLVVHIIKSCHGIFLCFDQLIIEVLFTLFVQGIKVDQFVFFPIKVQLRLPETCFRKQVVNFVKHAEFARLLVSKFDSSSPRDQEVRWGSFWLIYNFGVIILRLCNVSFWLLRFEVLLTLHGCQTSHDNSVLLVEKALVLIVAFAITLSCIEVDHTATLTRAATLLTLGTREEALKSWTGRPSCHVCQVSDVWRFVITLTTFVKVIVEVGKVGGTGLAATSLWWSSSLWTMAMNRLLRRWS